MNKRDENPILSDDQDITIGKLADSLGFLMRIAQVRVYDRFFEHFANTDLRPGEFSILWIIHLNPGIRQGRLAQTLNIKPAHMTKTIRRLEQANMVTRQIPDLDRRSVHLHLTSAGDTFIEDNQAHFFGENANHYSGLSTEESQQLTQLLKKYCGFNPD